MKRRRDPSVDFGYLARTYPLPGGNISNIALRAAFLAAAEDSPIAMRHLMSAVHTEYRKIGKVVPVSGTDPCGGRAVTKAIAHRGQAQTAPVGAAGPQQPAS